MPRSSSKPVGVKGMGRYHDGQGIQVRRPGEERLLVHDAQDGSLRERGEGHDARYIDHHRHGSCVRPDVEDDVWVTCWCEEGPIQVVPARMVREGLTFSCGAAHCDWLERVALGSR